MRIILLKERTDISHNIKLNRLYAQLSALLVQLQQHALPDTAIEGINRGAEELNAVSAENPHFLKLVKKTQTDLLKSLEKDFKIVPKNYYRNIWLALGMSAFGLPLGVAFGLSIGNMGLMSLGLPIGMVIGLSLGMAMDKKALREGRQLNIEIKY